MKLGTIICLVFLLFGSHNWVKAQHPDDAFNFHNANTAYLEHLLKSKVDSVRQTKGLKLLANDSILYLASEFHANYLVEYKKLSHNQSEFPDTKVPQQRAEKFGAKNYQVGENLVKTYANRKMRDKKGNEYYNLTYGQIASDLVKSWVNSPGHYENIINPAYDVTGLCIRFDSVKQEIKAVQKFADVKFKYSFIENKTLFPYSDYQAPEFASSFKNIDRTRIRSKFEWGLRAPKDSINYCQSCNTSIDTNIYKNKLTVKNRRITFYSPNIEMMHEIMSNRKSGLALELVEYSISDCGNPRYYTYPSRRNNQSILNGEVIKPVYRRHLKKGFKRSGYKWYHRIKKKGTPTHFEYALGKLSRKSEGYIEANVLVIKNKKICRVMHFSNVCGAPLEELYDISYLTKLNKYQYGVNPGERELEFTIPFEQGKYAYNYDDIKPLIDSLTSESFSVKSAHIKAYSSLEGSKEINLMLQKRRAKNIIKALENKQRSAIESVIVTDENWKIFEQQIKSEEALSSLRDLSRDEIRTKLTDKSFAKQIEPFLAKQRYGTIRLVVKFDATDGQIGQFLISEFDRYKDSIAKDLAQLGMTRNAKANMDTMASIQWYMYHLIKHEKLDTMLFEELVIPMHQDYSKLIKDHLWYDLDINGSSEGNMRWEASFYAQLNKLDRLGISSFEIRFDVMNYLLRNWSKRIPYGGDLVRLRDNINGLRQTAANNELKHLANQLWINFHVANANHKHFSNRRGRDDEGMRESMVELLNCFLEDTITDENRYALAQSFVYGEQEDLAFNMLDAKMQLAKPYVPSLILYTKLLFMHPEEWDDDTYVQYLIDVKSKLSDEEWCQMFVGPCNISFQVFDHEPLRQLYCESCAEHKNYAQRPEDWEK